MIESGGAADEEDAESRSSPAGAWVPVTRDVAVGGAAGLVGYVVEGPAAGVLGGVVAPLVSRGIDLLVTAWSGQSQRSTERVLHEAATLTGHSDDEFAEHLAAQPERLQLAYMALTAGSRTTRDDKVAALARCLATGAADDARVDPELIMVSALAELEGPHIKLLDHMATGLHVQNRGPSADAKWHRSWPRTTLAGALPELGPSLTPILATLLRHALVEEVPPNLEAALLSRTQDRNAYGSGTLRLDPPTYKVTDFGQACLNLLTEGQDDPPEGNERERQTDG